MWNQDQINELEANRVAGERAAQAYRQQQLLQQPKKKKGFWTDQISTGGSLAGALGGAAAGTAVLPGVGTLIGALLGGAAGGAGGQVAENFVSGDDLGKDVGSEALWGGATALPFGAVGKLAKAGVTAARGIGNPIAQQAAKDLVVEAGVKTMTPKAVANLSLSDSLKDAAAKQAADRLAQAPTLGQKLAGKLNGVADDLAVKQFRLTPTQLSNFSAKFGEDAGKTIRNYGFTTADDIATKGIEPLQNQFNSMIKNSGNIPTQTVKDNFDTAIAKLTNSASSTNQAIGKNLGEEVGGLLSKYGKEIPATELNKVRREFDGLVNYTQRVADPNKYGVNKRVADTLRQTLQGADPTGQLKNVGNELSKLRQLSDVVAKQGELGRGSLPFGLTQLLSGGVGGVTGGVPGALAGTAVSAAVNSPAGRRTLLSAADKVASGLSKTPSKNIGQTLKSGAVRIGGLGALSGALNSAGQSSDLNIAGNNTNAQNTTNAPISADPMISNIDSQYSKGQDMSSSGGNTGYSSDEIANALMNAYAAGDKKAADTLENMYQLQASIEKSQSKSLSSSAATQVASNANATNTLDQLQGLFGSAGGGSGKLAGTISNALAGAGLNGDVQTYNDLAASSVSQLARALNGGGQVSDADAAVVIQALPKVTDSKEVAQRKFAALRNRLQNALYNTQLYGGGAVDNQVAQ